MTTTTNNTKRYIRESALETRIAQIVEPVAESLGYDLVRVRITHSAPNSLAGELLG